MYIGIDIGGTNIKGVLLDGKKVIDKTKTPTRSKSSRKIIVAQIFNCINRLVDGRKGIKGIGIGVAGPVDFKNQRILNPPNVTGLRNLYLGKMVQNKFNIKTIIDNDVHCLVLAEAILGAGKGKKTIIGLGLGTGVGGGIVFNGKIFHGTNGTAAEIGHMIILWGDRQCRCGNKGCLEAYINEKGIRITASKIFGRKIDSITLYEMARKKDKKAIVCYYVKQFSTD